jgi:hypothetical protein
MGHGKTIEKVANCYISKIPNTEFDASFFSFDYLTEVPLTPFLAAERSSGGAYSRLSSNEVAESGP